MPPEQGTPSMRQNLVKHRAGWALVAAATAIGALGVIAVSRMGNRAEVPLPWVKTYGDAAPAEPHGAPLAYTEPLPALVMATIDGPRSVATFRMVDGTLRPVRLDGELRPGWRLTSLDTATATLTTPHGSTRIRLSGDPASSTDEDDAPRVEAPVRSAEDAPALTAEGVMLDRCTDPEC